MPDDYQTLLTARGYRALGRADGHLGRLSQGLQRPRPDARPHRVGNLLVRGATVVRVKSAHVREGTGGQPSYTVSSVS